MNDYISTRIDMNPCTEDMTDLAAEYLVDMGYESFAADSTGLTAYIPVKLAPDAQSADNLVEEALTDFPFQTEISIRSEYIKGRDWNEEWEKNYFQPIVIGNDCVIHSSFHKDIPSARYDIVIDPKMAFGTGHHATTSQMVQFILDLPMIDHSMIDMGTGTGILAILSAMRGAKPVTGIEIDEAAWINAVENAELNKVDLRLIHGDAAALENVEPADYLFANINRNIILEDIDKYVKKVKSGGEMMLSGFYTEDIDIIMSKASLLGLRLIEQSEQNRWAAIRLKKD